MSLLFSEGDMTNDLPSPPLPSRCVTSRPALGKVTSGRSSGARKHVTKYTAHWIGYGARQATGEGKERDRRQERVWSETGDRRG